MIEVHKQPSCVPVMATYTPLVSGVKSTPQTNKLVVFYQTKGEVEPNTWGIVYKCLISKTQIASPKQNEVLAIDGVNYKITYPAIDRNQALGIAPHWECQLKTIQN